MSPAQQPARTGAVNPTGPVTLTAAVGTYPHTAALKDGHVRSDLLRLDFADVPVISRAFAPMVRDLRFDVSEMAIATFLQAISCGKPLVLLPVILAARFQEGALLCRTDGPVQGPGDLAGRRIGVRAYSQTTGMWLRGILAETVGLRSQDVQWVTFEGPHVSEIQDPPWAVRAPTGQDMLAMLRAGDLDAVIVGNDVPDDPGLRTVYPDPKAAGERFRARHGFVPANHVLTASQAVVTRHAGLMLELLRLFHASAAFGKPGADPAPVRADLDPALDLALRFMAEQDMLPNPVSLDAIWAGFSQSMR